MTLNDWNVAIDDENIHHYLYGPLEEYDPDELKEFGTLVKQSEWTVEDYVTILENIAEDYNRHTLAEMFVLITDAMDKAKITYKQQTEMMRALATMVLRNILK